MEIAVQLGISSVDIDPVRIFFEVKNKALHDAESYSFILGSLRELHFLRRQNSRAQRNLPVDLKACPLLQVSVTITFIIPHNTHQSHFRTHTVSTALDSGPSSLVSMSMRPIFCVDVYQTYG